MRGHIRSGGKPGVWRVVVDLPRAEDGRRRQKWITIRGTKAEAEAALSRLLVELHDHGWQEPAALTMGALLDEWLAGASTRLRPSTVAQYTWAVRHLQPLVGDIPLQRFGPREAERALTEASAMPRADGRPGGLSSRSLALLHAVLFSALRRAEQMELIRSNPMRLVRAPRGSASESEEIPALTAEEARALLRVARGTRYWAAVVLAITAGLRSGEIRGLRWQDIDWRRGVLHVLRSEAGPTKTRASRRAVTVSQATLRALREYQRWQEAERLRAGPTWQGKGLVVCGPTGLPLSRHTLDHGVKRLMARAGIPPRRFHTLRHTMATLMGERGVPLKVVSSRLGHTDITTTANVYSHVFPSADAASAGALDDLFDGGLT